MKEVYLIQRSEYREDGNDQTVLAIHETLQGAIDHFWDEVRRARVDYMYDGTTSIDTSPEAMEQAGIEEQFHKDPDGTLDWHIWHNSSWHELFIHLYRKEVLA